MNTCAWQDESTEPRVGGCRRAWGPRCGKPATHYSCVVGCDDVNPNVCEKHKCRCAGLQAKLARLDADRTAPPKTQLVARVHATKADGHGIAQGRATLDDLETGKHTSLHENPKAYLDDLLHEEKVKIDPRAVVWADEFEATFPDGLPAAWKGWQRHAFEVIVTKAYAHGPWCIVNTDNFGGDYPDERFVAVGILHERAAQIMADALYREQGSHASRYFKVVAEGYVLQPGFEP